MIIWLRYSKTSIAQAVNLGLPFIYILLAKTISGDLELVNIEVFISVLAFFAIFCEWSSTSLLSAKLNSGKYSDHYTSLVIARLIIMCVLSVLFLLAAAKIFPNYRFGTTMSEPFIIAIIALIIDPAYILNSKKNLWISISLMALRYVFAISALLISHDFILNLSIGYLVSSLCGICIARPRVKNPTNVTMLEILNYYKNGTWATLSEIITAISTRCDVFIAVAFLDTQTAAFYLISRKIIIGLQSVVGADAKMLIIENNKIIIKNIMKNQILMAQLFFFVISPICFLFIVYVFQIEVQITYAVNFLIQATLIPLGVLKINEQFHKLYRSKKFKAELLITGSSIAATGIMLTIFVYLNNLSIWLITASRIFEVIFYIVSCKIYMHRDLKNEYK